tara:strand:- start:340 stop:690 length:351 start_codon:yes stop_codon:yes gene_type:complete
LVSLNAKADSGWTLVSTSVKNDKYYVDFQRIRINSGNKFFWYLIDYEELDQFGDKSVVTYSKAECGAFKYKWLDNKYYASGMGNGKLNAHDDNESPWKYPVRKSVMEKVINSVCDH